MKIEYADLGERAKQVREALGLTQKQVALEGLGYRAQDVEAGTRQVRRIEKGEASINDAEKYLIKLSEQPVKPRWTEEAYAILTEFKERFDAQLAQLMPPKVDKPLQIDFKDTTPSPDVKAAKNSLGIKLIELLSQLSELRGELAERLKLHVGEAPKYQSVQEIPSRELRAELIKIYSTKVKIQCVLDDAGVELANVSFQCAVKEIWFLALQEVDNVGCRQALISIVQEDNPNALADLLPTPNTIPPKTIADTILKGTALELARHLRDTADANESLRVAAQILGKVGIPLLAARTVRLSSKLNRPHLSIDTNYDDLTAIKVAGVAGRESDVTKDWESRVYDPDPKNQEFPPQILGEGKAKEIARWILLRDDGVQSHMIPTDPETLFKDANEKLWNLRFRVKESNRRQLYHLFTQSSEQVIQIFRECLPSLWLVEGVIGAGDEGGSLRTELQELYQWTPNDN